MLTKRQFLALSISSTVGLAMDAQAQGPAVLSVGLSSPLTGAAAAWGIGFQWVAEQAAAAINQEGGVQVGSKQWNLKVVSYDNKYTAAEGAKVAQALINRDGILHIAGVIGTAPFQALQSIAERKGALVFNTAWGMETKGPQFPMSFTQINTPVEILPELYPYLLQQHPTVKSVAMVNPNDATGQQTEEFATKVWGQLSKPIASSVFYERGTTEFQPVAAKLGALKPSLIDLAGMPPSDAGALLKELTTIGWDGVKCWSAGTSASSFVRAAGAAAEGVYMGLSADFEGPAATPIQRDLNRRALKEINESLNVITIGSWDSLMAMKRAIEVVQTTDPRQIAEALPQIIFESSYGPSTFGGAAAYGSPQQMLLPVIVSQIQDGKVVELQRRSPQELLDRLAKFQTPKK